MDNADASAKPKSTKSTWVSAAIGIVTAIAGMEISRFLGPVGWIPFIGMTLVFFALWPLKLSQYRWSGLALAGGQCMAIIVGAAIAHHLEMIELTAWLLVLDMLVPLALVVWAIWSRGRLPLVALIAYEIFAIFMNYMGLADLSTGDQTLGAWMHVTIRVLAIGCFATALITREPARRTASAAAS